MAHCVQTPSHAHKQYENAHEQYDDVQEMACPCLSAARVALVAPLLAGLQA
jgi:hypothetical protein